MQFSNVKELFSDFVGLVYPNLCVCCERPLVKQENIICYNCNISIPRTYYHLVQKNPIEQLFWGRVLIEKATSFYIFQKGSRYQTILHELKYKNNWKVGIVLGRLFAADLKANSYFDDVDVIVPVPLHIKKERKRGYNQSAAIVKGMSEILDIKPNMSNLYRKYYSETQTKKGRFERWENVTNLFALNDAALFEGLHILLVDDVVTTGATIEACAETLLAVKNVKVSVATLAFAAI